jgi:hypothetical protein
MLCVCLFVRACVRACVRARAQETSTIRQPRPDLGSSATERKIALRNQNYIIDSSKEIKVLLTVCSFRPLPINLESVARSSEQSNKSSDS